ncbi:Flagellar protein [Herminiimonas arsenicoxydans]|uniref:Flagellar secretion chaperone FliS n=1 Tax=Herminiimonas arsenicoxydans TaxID=204773 RepID=A4G683_HERAR|nr:Flagellar protein [Herminiimonas arsenicoxydans]
MFGSMKNGASAYAKVGIETGVIAANPHKLIVMLFEGVQIALNQAAQHMQSGHIAEKGKAISKAISIIDNGLRASLDKSTGGEIAINLDSLYEYMSNRLLLANLNNDAAVLQEVQTLLHDIKGAWESIVPKQQEAAAPTAQAAQIASSYESLAPNLPRLMKA